MAIIPPKLKSGDTVRVIAPAGSYLSPWITDDVKKRAKEQLEAMGLVVTYAKNLNMIDEFCSSPIDARIEDLHDAFRDPAVKLVITARGGFNSHQLFRYMDEYLIRNNPKILCGFSDITAIAHGIMVKTGLVTYSGPSYSTFGLPVDSTYTCEYFRKCVMSDAPFEVEPSTEWFDASPVGGGKPGVQPNPGPIVVQAGAAEGRLIGANACTMNMLQGTEYFPDLDGSILFIEDDYESQRHHFNSHLQSLILLPSFKGVKAIVIGRFEGKSGMNDDLIRKTIATYRELQSMPIIANVDFGHTQPMITFPIGGRVSIDAQSGKAPILTIIEH